MSMIAASDDDMVPSRTGSDTNFFTLGDRSLIRRDRSPSEQCYAAGEATGPWQSRPVPERVYAGRDRSRAGRDRFPNVGFSGAGCETGPRSRRPIPLGENCPYRADKKRGRRRRRRRRRRGEGACLEALEHHLLPHFLTLVASSLRLELCGGSNFNPTWF
uniref:Uncharacterized protein n=1 Tax=Ananas comosus var. bracteatus TaxID=296719 RepID=A0A6V7QC71_ANACO|nr:unnamed protein product [Ananas comosus var. bracteatus]